MPAPQLHPDVAKWLGPGNTGDDSSGGKQHAQYSKDSGTITAQMASSDTIGGQLLMAAGEIAKLGVDVSGPPEQVARFAQLCKTIETLCRVGASRTVQIDVDGG